MGINEFLKKLIIKNDLFLSGHYESSHNISVRDWIDLERLFSMNMDEFITPLTDGIYAMNVIKEDTCILGVNYYGAILSAILGYKYGISFSYYFDKSNIVDSSEKVVQGIEKYKTLFLITDVVVYGSTIVDVIQELIVKEVIDENVEIDLLVLFERKINQDYIPNTFICKNIRKIYVLNDDFNIEICNKNRSLCIFRNNETMNKYKKKIL